MQQTGQLTAVDELREIVETTFPNEEIAFSFGYGSGVLSQQLSSSTTGDDEIKVIDLILVVRDSRKFHRDNLQLNPDHYAVPRVLGTEVGASYATWLQRHNVDNNIFCNPRIYFNVTPRIKYGVVQAEDLSVDLVDWKYLYLAGRMHKPVVTIVDNTRPSATSHMDSIQYQQDNHNLPAALSTALLLLSLQNEQEENDESPTTAQFAEAAVYQQIAAISYTGDFRTALGAEDPRKIQKLVESPGQLERFRDLYAVPAAHLHQAGILSMDWSWDAKSPTARSHLWRALPPSLRALEDMNDTQTAFLKLAAALPTIVAPAARYQSFKGLFTAGVRKSAKYAARKFSKGLTAK